MLLQTSPPFYNCLQKPQTIVDNLQCTILKNLQPSNEPVEKVTFLKTASSAGSKIGNYFLPSKVFTILGEMFAFS